MAIPGSAIVVHGGAGRLGPEHREAVLDGCRRAAAAGRALLDDGGGALDAVQAAVRVLEDDPLFNAGRGGVLRSTGGIELDASLMDGSGQRAGAVAAVRSLANPICGARAVLEDGRHVLMVGPEAEDFLHSSGLPRCDPGMLVTAAQARRWHESFGTVGCVALDARGNLAAGTSTGGKFGDLPGRVGDSAIIGAGTWADATAAVSCTGHGEAIMRAAVAVRAADEMARGASVQTAARRALSGLRRLAGEGGLIALRRDGRIACACNSEHMPVCVAYPSGWIGARVVRRRTRA
ncbi:MAG TPA: isoaspartyl peptidase/L-asparaginase [Gammaproteobacteria bacterium]|nr:isoaspartyl peptidase/L-asparaginase [Gammaproteobacteria bacterium]